MTKAAKSSGSAFEPIDWYQLPRYYDAIFDVDTGVEASFLESAFDLHQLDPGGDARARRRRRVFEPAAGSGRLLVEMARRGWQVHGFDLEPEMVRFSRDRLQSEGQKGTVQAGDMASFNVRGTFDLGHCLVSTFKYLLDEESARGHLESVARALRPGGIYALGFHLTDYAETRSLTERWRVQRAGADVRCAITSWPPDRRTRLEPVRSRLRVTEKGHERRSETHWEFRTYDARQVRALLRSVPALEHVATYDFLYEIDEPQRFSDEQSDTLLILRKRA